MVEGYRRKVPSLAKLTLEVASLAEGEGGECLVHQKFLTSNLQWAWKFMMMESG